MVISAGQGPSAETGAASDHMNGCGSEDFLLELGVNLVGMDVADHCSDTVHLELRAAKSTLDVRSPV